MNSDVKQSTRSSAATSTKQPSGGLRSEASYLTEESKAARAAIRQARSDLEQRIAAVLDVRIWTRAHPWVSVGAATAAGFAIGSGLVSATRSATAASAPEAPSEEAPSSKTGKPSWLATLLKTVVEGVVQALVNSFSQPAEEPFAASDDGQPVEVEPASSGSDL